MLLRLVLLLALTTTGWSPAWAAAPLPVGADHAMVVSAQRLASQVGADIMKRGGNAIDAAVAVGYALAVAYPAAGNLGGGGFMTIRLADDRTTFLDFREKAPQAATAGMFLDAAGHVVQGRSTESWLAVGVPGSVAGLEAARTRYGTLPRETLIAPALALARDGFVLTEGDATLLNLGREALAQDAAASAVFGNGGTPFVAGQRLVQPALARSLEAISRDGEAAIYGGPVGQAIVAADQAGGGILTMADLTNYKVRELPTIECSYRGYDIHAAPPPSSGGVALCEMFNILEGYDLGAMGFHSAASVHAMAEAMRFAYRDRNVALGDPAFVTNPVAHLLDKTYAAAIRAHIPATAAVPTATMPAAGEAAQTTHFSIADAAGNAVSVTTTLNGWFGAHRMAGDTGILMNNEMDDFTAKTGVPNMFGLVQGDSNAVAPGKTPLSSMSPTIVTRDGKLVMVIGTPGGSRIITTVLETIVNLVDFHMSLSEAIDAPRFHMQGQPDAIAVEPFALSADTEALLKQAGYTIRPNAPWSMEQAILVGGPALSSVATESHALEIPESFSHRYQLYGATDDRGESGAAVGF